MKKGGDSEGWGGMLPLGKPTDNRAVSTGLPETDFPLQSDLARRLHFDERLELIVVGAWIVACLAAGVKTVWNL